MGVGVEAELSGEPVPIGMNVNGFFSVDSEDIETGGILGGLPKVKPTGLPILPPEVPELVAVEAPKVNFVLVEGNPPNGDGAILSLSKLVPPKGPVVDEVETPNPPNGLAVFSVLVPPNPLNTFVVAGPSDVLDDPEREEVVILSLSFSVLSPGSKVDDPPNKPMLVEDPPKRDPEVVLEVELPNQVDLELSFGGSSVVFFAREEAKKFGIAEEDFLSELVVLPKPNVGAGGPPDSEVGAGVKGNMNPLGVFELSVDVGGMKLLSFELTEGTVKLSGDFCPDVLGGMEVDIFGADKVEDADVLVKLGALKRIDGPGSGPRGRVFLGELLREPASCLSHTDWMVRRLMAY